jgi:hypothetical protein
MCAALPLPAWSDREAIRVRDNLNWQLPLTRLSASHFATLSPLCGEREKKSVSLAMRDSVMRLQPAAFQRAACCTAMRYLLDRFTSA